SASKFLRWLAATASTSRPGSFMSPNALVTLPKSNALVTSKAFATSAKPFLVVSFLAMVPSYTPFWVCGILRRTPGIYAVFWPDSRKMLRCNIDCAGPDHQPAQPSCDHWERPPSRKSSPFSTPWPARTRPAASTCRRAPNAHSVQLVRFLLERKEEGEGGQ